MSLLHKSGNSPMEKLPSGVLKRRRGAPLNQAWVPENSLSCLKKSFPLLDSQFLVSFFPFFLLQNKCW